jgi:hypothetical protein
MSKETFLTANTTYIQLMIMFKTERFNPENNVYEYAKEPDFEPIYQEIKRKGQPGVSTEFYNQWLQEYLTEMVDEYKQGYKVSNHDLELLFTIDEFKKWLKNRKEINDSPFDEKLLFKIWSEFKNSGIWEKIEFVDFYKSFQGKRNSILIIKRQQRKFCSILGLIEEYRDKITASNMEKWVKDTFGITEFKNKKGHASNEMELKIQAIIQEFCKELE